MKPENVSPSCKDVIVSMLWEMNFYFQLYACMFCLFRKKLAGTVPPPPRPLPHATALILPNKASCVKILVNPARVKTLCISRVQANPGSQELALPDIISGYLFGLPSLSLHLFNVKH